MFSICRKDLQQFFSNLTAYITMILFLVVTGLFLFVLRDSNLFDFGYATLDRFFELAPWVLLFMVPALGMRSFSDEFRLGTFETLRTRPIRQRDLVLGKYLALLIVLALVLLPTGLYVFTIKQLSATGTIDAGGIMGSYIGLFLLASVFAAVALCCSSFTSNAVAAFLISTFACLILYFGFSALSKLPVFQGGADYYLEILGLDYRYQSMGRGLLDLRDFVYLASLIIFFLLLTIKNTEKR